MNNVRLNHRPWVMKVACLEAAGRHRQKWVYFVEKLISCALTILRMNHSVAENQT
jgi:hypothetical protein